MFDADAGTGRLAVSTSSRSLRSLHRAGGVERALLFKPGVLLTRRSADLAIVQPDTLALVKEHFDAGGSRAGRPFANLR